MEDDLEDRGAAPDHLNWAETFCKALGLPQLRNQLPKKSLSSSGLECPPHGAP